MMKNTNPYGKQCLVLDVGGTSFRSSVFDGNKKLIEKGIKIPTPNFINNPGLEIHKLQNLLVDQIVITVKKYQKKYPKLDNVGISFPAPVTHEGVVRQACTIWGNRGKNFHLRKKLEEGLPKVNFVIANDITAAAERYASISKFKKFDYFAVITVSSGIGGKIYDVKNRIVVLDKRSIGGEMGHVKMDFSTDAPLCDCGGRGHLGAIASGRAVEKLAINLAKKHPKKYKMSLLYKLTSNPNSINNSLLIQAIKKNDKFSIEVLDMSTFPLACSISHISGNIGADKYIIIGGFALNCGNMYIKSLRRNIQKIDFYGRSSKEIAKLVELGIKDDNASLIGIGLLTLKSYVET